MRVSKILAGVLTATVIFNSISVYPLGAVRKGDFDEEVPVVSQFELLDEHVLYQEVDCGTKLSELELPRYLNAIVNLNEDVSSTPSDASLNSEQTINSIKIKIEWEINPSLSEADEYEPELPGTYIFDAFPIDEDKYQFDAEFPQIEVEIIPQAKMMKISNSSTNGWSYDEATSTVTIDSDEGLEDFKNNWNFETEIDSLYINKGVSEAGMLGNIKAKNLYIDCPYVSYMAFQKNDYIEYLEIGENVEDIDGYAFYSCSNLKKVDSNSYEKNLKKVNGYAFAWCDSLEYVRLPSSWFGGPVFQGCVNLEEVSLGLGNIVQETYVTWDMFSGCSSLKKVLLGTNLQKIDSSMFDGCSSLKELWLLNKDAPVIDEGAFDEVNQDLILYTYPNSVSPISDALAEKGYDFDVKIGVMCFFHTREYEYEHWEWEYTDTEHWKNCPFCGEEILRAPHSGGTATETEQAICEVCGQPYGELLEEACQHSNLSDWKYDGEFHWKECLDCGVEILKALHSGGTATETEQAICEVCGQPYGDLKENSGAETPETGSDDSDKSNSSNHSGGTSSTGKGVTSSGTYYPGGIYVSAFGEWKLDEIGWWYELPDGSYPSDSWYECSWNGQINWYHFNTLGYLDGGWFRDKDGQIYFLHDLHDNHFGYMYTGWNWINGKCYYFTTNQAMGGLPVGALVRNGQTQDGYTVNENGEWIVNGQVQTR